MRAVGIRQSRTARVQGHGEGIEMTRKPLIAVINDDPAFLEFVASFIESETTFETVVWDHGTDNITELRESLPDVVILDIRLGDQNVGAEILGNMRSDPQLQSIPVIVCTADSNFLQEESELLESLKADVLEKPFDLEALEQKVERALEKTPSPNAGDELDPVV